MSLKEHKPTNETNDKIFCENCKFVMFTNSQIYQTARGVVVIVVGNKHGDSSSNPGRDWLHFT